MSMLNKLWTKEFKNSTGFGLLDDNALAFLGINNTTSWDITYFICLKTLTEIMGKLDIKRYRYDTKRGKEQVYDEKLNYLLNIEPNTYYTASTLKQSVELQRNHYGNSYVYIERKGINVVGLWLLPTQEVQIYIDNAGIFGTKNKIWYVWTDSKTSKRYSFASQEILHFKSSVTWDGIVGKPVKDIIADNINMGKASRGYLNKLYSGGMQGNKVILHYTGGLDKKGEVALVEKMESFSATVGSGKYLPLPLGIQAEILESKLVDSEFSTLKSANNLDIAAAFGISPNHINDYSKSSYANSVTQQQSLYVNTMQPIFTAYGQEYSRKLQVGDEKYQNILEVDTKALFKLNPIEQMQVFRDASTTFTYSSNEMREELGLPYLDTPNADMPIGNGSSITLDRVNTQYNPKGGDNQ